MYIHLEGGERIGRQEGGIKPKYEKDGILERRKRRKCAGIESGGESKNLAALLTAIAIASSPCAGCMCI
jgi:hypothetical protein